LQAFGVFSLTGASPNTTAQAVIIPAVPIRILYFFINLQFSESPRISVKPLRTLRLKNNNQAIPLYHQNFI